MNIFFDVHILNPSLHNTATIKQNTLLETVYNYVYERISILKDEIEKEELECNNFKKPAIVIYLKNKTIKACNYSQTTHDKIVSCFNKNDADIMWSRVNEAIQNLMN